VRIHARHDRGRASRLEGRSCLSAYEDF
jgi:hypothetical protein